MFTLRVIEGPEASERTFTSTRRRVVIGSVAAADLQLMDAPAFEAILSYNAEGLHLSRGGAGHRVPSTTAVVDVGRSRVEVRHDPDRVSAGWIDAPPAQRWRRPGTISRTWIHDGFGAAWARPPVNAQVAVDESGASVLYSFATAVTRNRFYGLQDRVVDEDWAREERIGLFVESDRAFVRAPFFPGARFGDLGLLLGWRAALGQGEAPRALTATLILRALERVAALLPRWPRGISAPLVADAIVGWDGEVSLAFAPNSGGTPLTEQRLIRDLAAALPGLPLAPGADPGLAPLRERAERLARATGGPLPPAALGEALAALLPRDHDAQRGWMEQAETLI